MAVLVIAEHDNLKLSPSTLTTLTAANQLSSEIYVLVAGSQCVEVVEAVRLAAGVSEVIYCDNSCFSQPLAEDLTALTLALAPSYSHILAPATTFGKNFLPRLAALLDVAPISDVIAIEDQNTFQRPIYAGNAIATVRSADKIKVMTIRTTTFASAGQQTPAAPIKPLTFSSQNTISQFIGVNANRSERPQLTNAKIIVSGGRGLQSAEQFKIIEVLADRLKAAVGASRAAVDAGFVPNDYQVGQTGKVVAPDLYIAIGISGAIQHLAGIKDSKIIVAINKDPDAPIFEVADYGLVADFFAILPELEDALTKLGY
jgi:electron transfer flavoprotein alpha subunit